MNRTFIAPLLLTAVALSGCAAKGVVLNCGTTTKIFTPCGSTACETNEICCSGRTYDISWDRSCADYPVTYRSRQYTYEANGDCSGSQLCATTEQ